MRKLNFDAACYHSVQNLLYTYLLSENVKVRIRKTKISLWFCMGVKRSLVLREEHIMRVFENRVLRRIFEPCRD
jgi:hypothetical protein